MKKEPNKETKADLEPVRRARRLAGAVRDAIEAHLKRGTNDAPETATTEDLRQALWRLDDHARGLPDDAGELTDVSWIVLCHSGVLYDMIRIVDACRDFPESMRAVHVRGNLEAASAMLGRLVSLLEELEKRVANDNGQVTIDE